MVHFIPLKLICSCCNSGTRNYAVLSNDFSYLAMLKIYSSKSFSSRPTSAKCQIMTLFHLRLRRSPTLAEGQCDNATPCPVCRNTNILGRSNTTLFRNHTGTNGLFGTYGEHSHCALFKRSFANKSISLPTNAATFQNDQ